MLGKFKGALVTWLGWLHGTQPKQHAEGSNILPWRQLHQVCVLLPHLPAVPVLAQVIFKGSRQQCKEWRTCRKKLRMVGMRRQMREGKGKVVLEGKVVIKKLALERRNQMPKRGRGKRKNRRRKEQSLPGWTSCEKSCLCLGFIHSSMISVSLSVWRGEINELFKLC